MGDIEKKVRKTRTVLTPAQKLAKAEAEAERFRAAVVAGEEKRMAASQAQADAKASVVDLLDVVALDPTEVKALRTAVNEFVDASRTLAKLG